MFTNLSRRAIKHEYVPNLESFFRMAMKAQNQCRMTLETLATIKNPPVVFAKQANIAHGHQQVNNGVPVATDATHAHARDEKVIQSNELLEAQNGERMDAGATSSTSGSDKGLAALGKINGAKNRSRKTAISC